MDLAYIDQLSNSGDGLLNRCSVIPKVLLTGTFVLLTIFSHRLPYELFFFVLLVILHLFNKMPVGKIFHLVLYPVFFSLIFALIRFSYSMEEGFVLIFKATNSALAMILLITTTPYTKVFSLLRLFLPGVLVDGMFFTYRIFFILLEKIGNALTVLKLRGELRLGNVLFYLKHLAGVIGLVFINAFAMSERMYSIYSLRGYEGKLHEGKEWLNFNKYDVFPLGLSLVISTVVVIF